MKTRPLTTVLNSACFLAMLALSVSPIRSHAADQPPAKSVPDDSSAKTNVVMTEELMGRLIKLCRDTKAGILGSNLSKILDLNDGTKDMPMQWCKSDSTDGKHNLGVPPALDSTDVIIAVMHDTPFHFEIYLTDKTGKLRAAAVNENGVKHLITNEKAAEKFKAELELFAKEAEELPPTKAAAQLPPTAASFEGTLQTGVLAVGGETTGIVLKTKADGEYELVMGGLTQQHKDDLQKLANTLNGKKVVGMGDYKPRAGVEGKERRIILVDSLKEAP